MWFGGILRANLLNLFGQTVCVCVWLHVCIALPWYIFTLKFQASIDKFPIIIRVMRAIFAIFAHRCSAPSLCLMLGSMWRQLEISLDYHWVLLVGCSSLTHFASLVFQHKDDKSFIFYPLFRSHLVNLNVSGGQLYALTTLSGQKASHRSRWNGFGCGIEQRVHDYINRMFQHSDQNHDQHTFNRYDRERERAAYTRR